MSPSAMEISSSSSRSGSSEVVRASISPLSPTRCFTLVKSSFRCSGLRMYSSACERSFLCWSKVCLVSSAEVRMSGTSFSSSLRLILLQMA
jgi:hypothetical protein